MTNQNRKQTYKLSEEVIEKIKQEKVGNKYDNYPTLCRALGLEVFRGANQKTAQLKELQRYCKLEKEGISFVLKEVYEVPLPKIDDKEVFEGVYYMVLHYLAEEFKKGENIKIETTKEGQQIPYIIISRNKIAGTIGLIHNKNFALMTYNTEEYLQLIEKEYGVKLDKKTVDEFLKAENSKCKERIEKVFNILENQQKLIKVTKGTRVVFKKGDKEYHINCSELEDYTVQYLERRELQKLGFNKIQELYSEKDKNGRLLISVYYENVTKAINESYLNQKEIDESIKKGIKVTPQKKLFDNVIDHYYYTYVIRYLEMLEDKCKQVATTEQLYGKINKFAYASAQKSSSTRESNYIKKLEEVSKGMGKIPEGRKKVKEDLEQRLPNYSENCNIVANETIKHTAIDRTTEIEALVNGGELGKKVRKKYIEQYKEDIIVFNHEARQVKAFTDEAGDRIKEIEDKYITKEIAKVNLLYCLTKEYENEEKLKNIDTKTLCKIVTEIRKININDAWKGRVIIALIALTNEDFINL